jgi:hypothetical protein
VAPIPSAIPIARAVDMTSVDFHLLARLGLAGTSSPVSAIGAISDDKCSLRLFLSLTVQGG